MLEIFKEPFMQTALLGGLITACLCAYLGVFVILKRIVFMGVALSQVAALGVASGLFVGVNPIISAFVLTLFGIILFWRYCQVFYANSLRGFILNGFHSSQLSCNPFKF
ncbi:MAG: metal ABC transporter permease [Nitrospirota bacterium]